MAENSNIEWTDHTFNPWWGCVKVSPGCKHCYAETLDKRWDGGHWGAGSDRRIMADSYWKQPVKWNRDVELGMTNKNKVFCASMADVFEDHPQVVEVRKRLFKMIEETPFLIWQLLTKRPENIANMVPDMWLLYAWPKNVWIGTTVENQEMAQFRIPHLACIPATVRFISCEPMLSKVVLKDVLFDMLDEDSSNENGGEAVYKTINGTQVIQWVICGGESGHTLSRPMNDRWAQWLREECKHADIAFFFKQWGDHIPISQVRYLPKEIRENLKVNFGWPGDMPDTFKLGKKATGCLLDGVEHKNFPV